MAGLVSLAYDNANEIVVDMAKEALPGVQHTLTLAGINGTDQFIMQDTFLNEFFNLGFSGMQNFPTVGLIDGTFRANLEETGMGFELEVGLIRAAQEKEFLYSDSLGLRILAG